MIQFSVWCGWSIRTGLMGTSWLGKNLTRQHDITQTTRLSVWTYDGNVSEGRPVLKDKIPKIGPQIDNLPCPQPNQHTHCAERKPFNSLIGTLIGISQLLLSIPQVLHLIHNLGKHLFYTLELCLDRLQLLLCLNSRPVFCVGTDINIKLYVS